MGPYELDGNDCLFSTEGSNADLPSGSEPYTLEAWINPSGSGLSSGGIVGWGNYGSVNQVNAFRLAGWSGLVNYWWGNDLVASTVDLARNTWTLPVASSRT